MMKPLLHICLTLLVVGWVALPGWSERPGGIPGDPALADPALDHVPGEILVGVAPGAAPGAAQAALARARAAVAQGFPGIGVLRCRLAKGGSVAQALRDLGPAVGRGLRFVEPNYLLHAQELTNDPLRVDLFGLHNVGQTGGTVDADIDAPEAWEATTGSAGVVVGVIDSGIDYNHPDLDQNIWINPGEDRPPLGTVDGADFNGLDDDGNGKVDDLRGWDFANNDNDPLDDNSHGTHVSGTIGALGNNGLGVVGVSRTVRLMALKFLNAGGSGSTANAIAAIQYAAGKGVPITNNSWGGGAKSRALEDAIAASGALFVAAAGNDGTNQASYPARYAQPNILSVAATDQNDALASFSNYNATSVDLGAPGVGTLSTVLSGAYGKKSGTSMAAPHVSGAAALLLAQHPGWSVAQVKAQLMNSVDATPSLAGKTVTGGRLNARRAVGAAEFTPDASVPAMIADLAGASDAPDAITLTWTATGDDGSAGTAFAYDLRFRTDGPVSDGNWATSIAAAGEPAPQAAGAAESFTVAGLSSNATYYFGLRALDDAGNASPTSNSPQVTTLLGGWLNEVVDGSAERTGFYTSLDFHPVTGRPALAYSDETHDRVKFAAWNGSAWSIEVVGAGTDGAGTDLAYSPAGVPSVSWGWGKLRYAEKPGATWNTVTLENSNAYNDITRLVYGPDGNPYISYQASSALKLAKRVGGVWQKEVVHAGAGARYSSLAFDPATGFPAIAYSDDADANGFLDTLRLARWNGSGWAIETIETGVQGYGVLCALAFDPVTGHPAILHSANSSMRFARWDGRQWVIEVAGTGTNPSLAYAADGAAWIVYGVSGPNNPVTKAARRTTVPGSGWTEETVDTAASGGFPHRIRFGPDGLPAAAYRDSVRSDQKFARKQTP